MTGTNTTIQRLLSLIPDEHKFVELRALLLSDECEVYGFAETDRLSFVACYEEPDLAFVYGRPARAAIRQVAERQPSEDTILCLPEDRAYVEEALPEWRSELAHIYRLVDDAYLPKISAGAVRFLTSSELEAMSHVPAELKEELLEAAEESPVAATFVEELPVSFCYAGSRTETLWDISIDTLAEYRQRGYAALCVAFMIEHFRQQGLAPVWGALESNLASMKLAEKLGFAPVDQLVVFEASDQDASA
ncbi:MAG: GNAT family N-acetyltransferase [Acidobacteria bacterium]|nr:GNAT family N-acetyltransferase [Acidobacteriota bacterium]